MKRNAKSPGKRLKKKKRPRPPLPYPEKSEQRGLSGTQENLSVDHQSASSELSSRCEKKFPRDRGKNVDEQTKDEDTRPVNIFTRENATGRIFWRNLSRRGQGLGTPVPRGKIDVIAPRSLILSRGGAKLIARKSSRACDSSSCHGQFVEPIPRTRHGTHAPSIFRGWKRIRYTVCFRVRFASDGPVKGSRWPLA